MPRRAHDLLGPVGGTNFEGVRLVGPDPRNKNLLWLFRCKEGHEFVRRGSLVGMGKLKHCPVCRGARHSRAGKFFVDLAGITLGAFVVVRPTGRVDQRRHHLWEARAPCGCIRLFSSHTVRLYQRKALRPACEHEALRGRGPSPSMLPLRA